MELKLDCECKKDDCGKQLIVKDWAGSIRLEKEDSLEIVIAAFNTIGIIVKKADFLRLADSIRRDE